MLVTPLSPCECELLVVRFHDTNNSTVTDSPVEGQFIHGPGNSRLVEQGLAFEERQKFPVLGESVHRDGPICRKREDQTDSAISTYTFRWLLSPSRVMIFWGSEYPFTGVVRIFFVTPGNMTSPSERSASPLAKW